MNKAEMMGQKILKRIHQHNKDNGGYLTQTTGAMGSGKTSVNLSFTEYTINHYPNEKIFWSECYDAPLQIYKLNRPDKIHLMVEKGSGVIFRDRDAKLRKVDLNPTYFDSFDDMYQYAKPGMANVVFFGDRLKQMELDMYLRSVGEWTHKFCEEFSEIAPMYPSKELWSIVKKYAKVLKDVRKCMMNLHYNTQQVSDIFHECRNKVMIKIFLPGAITEKNIRLTQRAIDGLKRDPVHGNQAYLVEGGEFGLVTFSDIYKPVDGYHYEAHVETKNE